MLVSQTRFRSIASTRELARRGTLSSAQDFRHSQGRIIALGSGLQSNILVPAQFPALVRHEIVLKASGVKLRHKLQRAIVEVTWS